MESHLLAALQGGARHFSGRAVDFAAVPKKERNLEAVANTAVDRSHTVAAS